MKKVRPEIVIIGGGFCGAAVAARLARRPRLGRVTLIDDSEYFLFPARIPDLIGSADFPTRRLMAPFVEIAHRNGYEFLQTRVGAVDRAHRTITLADGTTRSYDYLVVAIGARDNFYGVPGAREHAAPYWSYEDVVALRQRALHVPSGGHIVVVGGGPTGVELTGSLAQCCAGRQVNLTMLTAQPDILYEGSAAMRRSAHRCLKKLGVRVVGNATVTAVTPDVVRTRGEVVYPTHLTVWAGGIQSSQLSFSSDIERDKNGYFLVDEYLRIDDHIFGGGDCVIGRTPETTAPKTGQHAREMAIIIEKNLTRAIKEKSLRRFRPYTLGTILSFGPFTLITTPIGQVCSRYLAWARDLFYRWRLRELIGRWPG
jgi:NADH dehydrogenase FAD-containing subunit